MKLTFDMVWVHFYISLVSVVIAVIVGVPLAVICYWHPRTKSAIMTIADILQTIPGLAMLVILMVILGAGKTCVIIGMFLYSLMPVIFNTHLGLTQVDPGVVEAARGMGMSRLTRLLRVELPLALPLIITGIRVAMVNAIGTAVFSCYVGGGGLGNIITRGIKLSRLKLVLAGTGSLMAMSVILDVGLEKVGDLLDPKRKGRRKARGLAAQTSGASPDDEQLY